MPAAHSGWGVSQGKLAVRRLYPHQVELLQGARELADTPPAILDLDSASNSATRRVNASIRASRSAIIASRSASDASSRASRGSTCAADSESDTPPRIHQTTHQDQEQLSQEPAEQLLRSWAIDDRTCVLHGRSSG